MKWKSEIEQQIQEKINQVVDENNNNQDNDDGNEYIAFFRFLKNSNFYL